MALTFVNVGLAKRMQEEEEQAEEEAKQVCQKSPISVKRGGSHMHSQKVSS